MKKILILLITLGFNLIYADPYGTLLGSYNGVNVYSNGTVGYVSNDYNYVNGTNTGMKWQCVEFVNRYYLVSYGLNIRVIGDNAVNYYTNAYQHGLIGFPNNGNISPAIGDVLCFSGGNPNYGHVAIVREIGSNYLRVAQQNVTENSNDVNFQVNMTVNSGSYNVSGSVYGSSYICQGWLRIIQPPVLTSPGNPNPPGPIINTLTPTFVWQSVVGASRYGLYVRDTTTGILIINIENITETSYAAPSGIFVSDHYFRWNMRAFGSNNVASSYSNRFYFQIQQSGSASVQTGVTISPIPVNIGQNFSSSFTLKEIQGASVTYDTITCAILRNDNSHCFDMGYFHNITISANSTWNYNSTVIFPTSFQPGTYKAVARGKLVGGNWFDFGVTGGGINPFIFNAQNPNLIEKWTTNTPKVFQLYQNYPNPFNPSTRITFDIPENSLVKISLFDITGKEVQKILNDPTNAGTYQFTWDATEFPNGIYFCKMETNNFSKTIKLVLIK